MTDLLVHAALPLALLQTMQALDTPVEDGLDEYHQDLSTKRFGLSPTVAVQIGRFERLAGDGGRVDPVELVALLRLVGRRPDASLVFTDAGRRAGGFAATGGGVATLVRALPGFAGQRAGLGVARRRARQVFGLALAEGDGIAATLADQLPIDATPDGAACAFYGAGLAEVLRRLIDFEGAMMHVRCRGRADAVCEWRTAPTESREDRT